MTNQFDIVEIKIEEGVDLGSGIKDFLLPNVVLNGEFFYCSTSLVDSTWVICQ